MGYRQVGLNKALRVEGFLLFISQKYLILRA